MIFTRNGNMRPLAQSVGTMAPPTTSKPEPALIPPQIPPLSEALDTSLEENPELFGGEGGAGAGAVRSGGAELDQALAALTQKAEELAAANARIAELEARVEAPADVEWPDLNEKLSDWDEVGHGAIASNIPAAIAELMEPGETLTHDVRRKLTERLNVELAELKNLRGLAGEDLKREAEIEKLLGLFARLGEI